MKKIYLQKANELSQLLGIRDKYFKPIGFGSVHWWGRYLFIQIHFMFFILRDFFWPSLRSRELVVLWGIQYKIVTKKLLLKQGW